MVAPSLIDPHLLKNFSSAVHCFFSPLFFFFFLNNALIRIYLSNFSLILKVLLYL